MQEIGIGGCFFPTFSCQWHGEFTSWFFCSFIANLDLYKKKGIPKCGDSQIFNQKSMRIEITENLEYESIQLTDIKYV